MLLAWMLAFLLEWDVATAQMAASAAYVRQKALTIL
jgi:hypothetical protein